MKINWLNYTSAGILVNLALYFIYDDPDIKRMFVYLMIGFGIITLLLLIKKIKNKK